MNAESEEVPRGEFPDLDEQEDLAAQQEALQTGDEGAEPGESPEAGDTGDELEPPADDLDLLDPDAQLDGSPADAGARQPASDTPQPYEPPPGGQPFAFKVDGRDVSVEGALRWDHGIYIPAAAWERLQRDHVADRPALYRAGAERGYREAESRIEQHPRVLEAQAVTKEFLELMAKTPQQIAEWLDNYNTEKPLLFERLQRQVAEQRLRQLQQQGATQANEAAVQTLVEQIPVYVDRAVDAVLAQDESLKLLAAEKPALVKWLMSPGVIQSVLFEADRDYPEANLRQGQIVVRHDVIRSLLGPIAEKAAATAKQKRLDTARRRNSAALGQGRTAPLAVPGRGAPAVGPRKPKPVTRESWREDLLGTTPEDEE